MISGLTQQLESLEQKYIMLYKRLQAEEKFPKERAGMVTFKLVIYILWSLNKNFTTYLNKNGIEAILVLFDGSKFHIIQNPPFGKLLTAI